MKYLILGLLFTSCSNQVVKRNQPVVVKPLTRTEKLVNCVDKYLTREINISNAYEVCNGIYTRL